MLKKFINIVIMTLCIIMSSSLSYSASMLTYDKALELALKNDNNIKVYQEILNYYINQDKSQISNPLNSAKDYEYILGEEIEKPLNIGEFDYKKAISDASYQKKILELSIESETLDYFKKLILLQDDIRNLESEGEIKFKQLNIIKSKYALGMVTKNEYEFQKNSYDSIISNIEDKKRSWNLIMDEFKAFLNIKDTPVLSEDNISELITIDKQSLVVPQEAIDFAKKNKKSIVDLEKDLQDYREDLERYGRIYPEGTYYYEVKKEEIEKKFEEAEDTLTKQLYAFEKTYLNLMYSIDTLSKIDLEINKKVHEINYYKTLFENGQISTIDYLSKKQEIENLKKDKKEKLYEIKSDILNYRSMINQ